MNLKKIFDSQRVKDSDESLQDIRECQKKLRDFISTCTVDEVDSHYSDLYLKVTPESTELINSLPKIYRLGGAFTSRFISNIDKEPWYEIAFGNPYYDYEKGDSRTDFTPYVKK